MNSPHSSPNSPECISAGMHQPAHTQQPILKENVKYYDSATQAFGLGLWFSLVWFGLISYLNTALSASHLGMEVSPHVHLQAS